MGKTANIVEFVMSIVIIQLAQISCEKPSPKGFRKQIFIKSGCSEGVKA